MPDPVSAHLLDGHLAAGDGWVLSRGRLAGTGELVLLVSSDAGDPVAVVELRRRLAVAGSVAGPHLASVVSAGASTGGGVVVLLPPAGPSLAALVASRGPLAPGEVVTLVAPLASTLATLHERGLVLADVTTATVWLARDGRPVLLPVGIRDASPAVAGGAVSRVDVAGGDVVCGDVVALAATAFGVLDRESPGAGALAAVLKAAVEGRLDAAGLGAATLRSARALPIATAAVVPLPTSRHHARGSRRRPAVRIAALVGAVVIVGVVLGGLWGRHEGDVLAAPPPLSPSLSAMPKAEGAAPAAASRVVPSWRTVMTMLERARSLAYATGDPGSLSSVYAAGSPTGRADVRLMRGLARHGRHAVGLQTYVEHVHVVDRAETRVTLLVTDALTAYDVVGRDGEVVRRGTGRPSRTWRVTLVRAEHGWRIWSVTPATLPCGEGGGVSRRAHPAPRRCRRR
jgi:eukaryotic-like serine/threonine-protein kinase